MSNFVAIEEVIIIKFTGTKAMHLLIEQIIAWENASVGIAVIITVINITKDNNNWKVPAVVTFKTIEITAIIADMEFSFVIISWRDLPIKVIVVLIAKM